MADIHNFCDIASLSESSHSNHQSTLLDIFSKFLEFDPDLGKLVVGLFDGDDQSASIFMSKPNACLGHMSPYQALSAGNRDDVLDLIYKIEFGMYG